MLDKDVFSITLSDNARVIFFALRHLAPIGHRELGAVLHKSTATMFRGLAELRAAGLLPPARVPPKIAYSLVPTSIQLTPEIAA